MFRPAPLQPPGTPAPSDYERVPPRSLNGGLYTGEPFQPGAPWANVPAPPEAGVLMHGPWLRGISAPGAEHHVPGGGWRPGNNTPLLPEGALRRPFPELNMTCVARTAAAAAPASAAPRGHGLRKYAFW